MKKLGTIGDAITAARPTAVNMGWAVERLLGKAESTKNTEKIPDRLLEEAKRIQQEDEGANRRMGKYGAELLPDEGGVLTHCNTGALATGGYGTALGVIRAAWESGKRFRVFNTETRPWLQGARLTSWELQRLEIPNTLLVDSAAGLLMRRGMIRCVVLGADRIAANGDVANKIGTYMLAVLAHENDVPFYVAAPISTVDLNTPSGDAIPIEERLPREVTSFGDVVVAPEGVQAVNPAFDITLHRYITAIITERGVVRPPYISALREVVQQDV
jgi:methylthioribose-1-phosphate isomerase